MKTIPLTQGKVALVDDEDYERVSRLRWHARHDRKMDLWYAAAGGPAKQIILQRFLVHAEGEQLVDHINGDGLDNRRVNLRVVSRAQNQQNRHKQRNNTSGYRGVGFHRPSKKWVARIGYGSRYYYLGSFTTPEMAAAAYDAKAKELYGEGARPSKIERVKR